MGKMWKPCQISFSWAAKSMRMVTAATKLRCLLLGRMAMTNLEMACDAAEDSWKSSLDSKEISQPWIFIGRTEAEAGAPILWPHDVKSQYIRKDLDSGKDQGQEEKGTTEDEVVGQHHWLKGHEFERTQGDSEGWGRLACYSPWGHKELDMT